MAEAEKTFPELLRAEQPPRRNAARSRNLSATIGETDSGRAALRSERRKRKQRAKEERQRRKGATYVWAR